MKLTKILEEVISEVGDASNIDTYKYSRIPTREEFDEELHKVVFTTDSGINYAIWIYKIDRTEENIWRMDVEFGVESKDKDFDTKSVVNKGEMYKVMATVVKVVKEELEISKKGDKNIVTIRIEPSKNFKNDSRRANLYLAYIKKNMPKGSTVTAYDDFSTIEIDLPRL